MCIRDRPCTFGGADVKAEVKAYQAVHARVAQNVALALAHPLASELMALAREVTARFEDATVSYTHLWYHADAKPRLRP